MSTQELTHTFPPYLVFYITLLRLLVLVYGFLTAVEEYSDKYWPGTVTVAAVLFVLVWAVMFPSWLTALWCKDSERKLDQQQQQAEEEASGLWLSYPGMQGRCVEVLTG